MEVIMATPTTRSRLISSQSRKSYRLEMEAPTLFLLLGMMIATGVVLFYLGMVTGMAMREPTPQVAATTTADPATTQPPTAAENLSFNKALEQTTTPLESVQTRTGQATQRTEELLSKARKEMELEESTTAQNGGKPAAAAQNGGKPAATTQNGGNSATTANAARPAATARTPTAPAGGSATSPAATAPRDSGLYTVQVFSSQSHERAQELVTRLKGKGYGAFLSRFETSDRQVWYRVRVGKTSREEADAMADKLINEERLTSTQVLKL